MIEGGLFYTFNAMIQLFDIFYGGINLAALQRHYENERI